MKVTLENICFMAAAIVPQLWMTAVYKHFGFVSVIILLSYMTIPCRDRQFGQGRPFHWVRQVIFAGAAVVAIVLMFL